MGGCDAWALFIAIPGFRRVVFGVSTFSMCVFRDFGYGQHYFELLTVGFRALTVREVQGLVEVL